MGRLCRWRRRLVFLLPPGISDRSYIRGDSNIRSMPTPSRAIFVWKPSGSLLVVGPSFSFGTARARWQSWAGRYFFDAIEVPRNLFFCCWESFPSQYLFLRPLEMLFHLISFRQILTHSSNTPLGEKGRPGFAVQLFSSGRIPWHCLNLHYKFPCSAASPLEKKEDPPFSLKGNRLAWKALLIPTSLEFHSSKSPSSSLRARLFQALQPSTFLSWKLYS